MKRRAVTSLLLIAFVSCLVTPIFAHQTSGSDCDALWKTIIDAGAAAAVKLWKAIKTYWKWQNTEGTFATLRARVAYYKAGYAWKRAMKTLKKQPSIMTSTAVPEASQTRAKPTQPTSASPSLAGVLQKDVR